MRTGELQNQILEVCMVANKRMLTAGESQYVYGVDDPDRNIGVVQRQRFEDELPSDHFRELEEELYDVINWAAMTVLKIRERRKALGQAIEDLG